jgi:Ser/Thr protein kinase RdoA (MazF antagonist)
MPHCQDQDVLPLSRISVLRATIDDEWRSSVADDVAAAWGLPPGSARFWRSSASHVFVTRGHPAAPAAFLRFVPADLVDRAAVVGTATLMDRLAVDGLGCVPVVRSTAGALVATVDTVLGQVHAMLVAQAPGTVLDVDDVDEGAVERWGSALARVHRDGTTACADLSIADGPARIHRALDEATDDGLAEAADVVRRHLDRLPRDGGTFGLVHGDFELDNMAWDDRVATAFDWDEAERSWFAADIAYAVRDLVPDPTMLRDPAPALDAFLAGYRSELPESRIDREALVLCTGVNALRSLARLRPVLAEDAAEGADLVVGSGGTEKPLRSRLEQYAERQRRIATGLAAMLREG